MREITHLTNAYRESARHRWNSAFLPLLSSGQDPWEVQERFEDVSSELFKALVLGSIGRGDARAARGDEGLRLLSPF